MTRHAILALIGMMLALWACTRACNPPIPAASDAPPSATWGPGQADPRGMAWLPVTGATVKDRLTVGAWGAWSWVDVAVARAEAGKPTAAATPTRTPAPTDTRGARPTRTARPTGTPTQGNMLPPPTCGAGTVEPGLWTPWPPCYPFGGTFTPTPTDTATPRDTPPASATWEPTPTALMQARPAAVRLVNAEYRYLFPLVFVWRARPTGEEKTPSTNPKHAIIVGINKWRGRACNTPRPTGKEIPMHPDCTTSLSDAAILGMTPADIARFVSKVDTSPGHGPNGDCHIWSIGSDSERYGRFSISRDGRDISVRAPRVAFFLANGHIPPPETPCVLHSCDYPPCVRGDHLGAGTHAENRADCKARGRTRNGSRSHIATRPRGSRHPHTSFDDGDVSEIRARWAAGGITKSDLMREYGVSHSTIRRILLRQTWAHVA